VRSEWSTSSPEHYSYTNPFGLIHVKAPMYKPTISADTPTYMKPHLVQETNSLRANFSIMHCSIKSLTKLHSHTIAWFMEFLNLHGFKWSNFVAWFMNDWYTSLLTLCPNDFHTDASKWDPASIVLSRRMYNIRLRFFSTKEHVMKSVHHLCTAAFKGTEHRTNGMHLSFHLSVYPFTLLTSWGLLNHLQ
jgi:hypothetical protein